MPNKLDQKDTQNQHRVSGINLNLCSSYHFKKPNLLKVMMTKTIEYPSIRDRPNMLNIKVIEKVFLIYNEVQFKKKVAVIKNTWLKGEHIGVGFYNGLPFSDIVDHEKLRPAKIAEAIAVIRIAKPTNIKYVDIHSFLKQIKEFKYYEEKKSN